MLRRLQQFVTDHLALLLVSYQAKGRRFPAVWLREFQLFLTCANPSAGHAIAGCSSCGFERVIYYSCKRRSMCWRCVIRRRDDLIPHIMQNVLPRCRARHVVLTLPIVLRINLRSEPKILSAVRHIFIRRLFHHLRMKAKRVLGIEYARLAHPGAISVTHYVSSILEKNIHFHAVILDGVCLQEKHGGPATFHPLPGFTEDELTTVARDICRKTRGMLIRRGLWVDSREPAPMNTVRGSITLRKVHRVTLYGTAARAKPAADVQPEWQAFRLFAGDAIEPNDRIALKNLMLYLLSPPFTGRRLSILGPDTIRLRLRRPRRDGSLTVTFTGHEWMQALIALIAHPRQHNISYHGALGRRSPIRKWLPSITTIPPKPFPVHRDPETADYRRVRLALHVRAHREQFSRCPSCSDKLVIVMMETPRMHYSNPAWIHPDTPVRPAAAPAHRPEQEQSTTT